MRTLASSGNPQQSKMAPVGDKVDRNNIMDDTLDEDEDQNLWAKLLSEVQSGSSTKLPSNKSILVLGENESGKTTLIAKLQGTEDPKKGAGLEYHYIDVKDEYRDERTRCGVWILDGDPYHTGLLRFALTKESFPNSLVVLVVSMEQPWAIMEQLRKWSTILQDHIERLRIPHSQMASFEEHLVHHFQDYQEPEEGVISPPRPRAFTTEEEKVVLPLGETTLTHNPGIPIVVVVTKSDEISTLEKEHDYREEHFDFIQQYIRKFCLNYGAALFYTSVKEAKNCDLLYKYLVHRVYNFPFTTPAYVVERDSVFIPSGWDTEKKISILYENMTSMKPDDVFDTVIVKPVMRKPIQRDAEVLAEDEQAFLMKQQTQLSKQPTAGTRPEGSPMRPSGGVQKTSTSPRVGASPTTPALSGSPKKLDGGKPGAGSTSEGVLANFFSSLLSKKTGGTAAPGAGLKPTDDEEADRAAVSRDAAAELDRMTRTKKPHPGGPAPNNTTAS